MMVCFPVRKDKGVESRVNKHFGTAPVFIVIETDKRQIMSMPNADQHHAYGSCNPIRALNHQKVDAVIVGGIGAGALTKLRKSGIKVFHSQAPTVKENLKLLKRQGLPEFKLIHCCTGRLGQKSACRHY